MMLTSEVSIIQNLDAMLKVDFLLYINRGKNVIFEILLFKIAKNI